MVDRSCSWLLEVNLSMTEVLLLLLSKIKMFFCAPEAASFRVLSVWLVLPPFSALGELVLEFSLLY